MCNAIIRARVCMCVHRDRKPRFVFISHVIYRCCYRWSAAGYLPLFIMRFLLAVRAFSSSQGHQDGGPRDTPVRTTSTFRKSFGPFENLKNNQPREFLSNARVVVHGNKRSRLCGFCVINRATSVANFIVHKLLLLLLLLYLLAAGHCICRCSTLIYLTITAFNHSAVFHVCVWMIL